MKWLAVLVIALWTWGTLGCGGVDRDGDGMLRIVCLGDSNTDRNFKPNVPTWCERLQARHPEWEIINRGATYAVARGCGILQACSLLAAALQLEFDVVLLAFGTNDLYGGATAEEVVVAL